MTFYTYAYPWEYILEDTVIISGIPTFISAQNKWEKVTEGFIYDSLLLSLDNRDAAQDEITNAQLTANIIAALSKPNDEDRKIGIAFKLNGDPQSCFYDIGISTSGYPFEYDEEDLILEIEYNLVNVTYLNDFDDTDPKETGYGPGDFLVTPPNASVPTPKANRDIDGWDEIDFGNPVYGTLVMYPHDDIEYATDNSREYNREPKQWERTGGGINPAYGPLNNETWSTAFITDESQNYTFTANFYRLVDNKFKAYALGSALGGSTFQIAGDFIGIDTDGDLSPNYYANSPVVYQRKDFYIDDYFNAMVPFFYTSGGSTGIFLGWTPDDNGTSTIAAETDIDYTNNQVTTKIIPDLHHLDTYGNTYKAYYGQFKAMALDHASGNLDITSRINAGPLPIQVTGYDASNEAVQVKVPLKYYDNQYGITYVFAGWWDGVYGVEDPSGTTASRHVYVNNYSASTPRYDMVAMYKAHMNSGDAAAVTKTNSQRKIAVDAQGRHHSVYESAGLIWYTVSTDNGQTWAPEMKVNAGLYQDLTSGKYDGYCRRPAIAVASEGNLEDIVITYIDENTNGNPGVYVVQPIWSTYDLVYTSEKITEPKYYKTVRQLACQ